MYAARRIVQNGSTTLNRGKRSPLRETFGIINSGRARVEHFYKQRFAVIATEREIREYFSLSSVLRRVYRARCIVF